MALEDESRALPYGILFVHGRRFNGFHVRFRDIARGGMRLVTPASAEQYSLESARQYDECYGLAYAQQVCSFAILSESPIVTSTNTSFRKNRVRTTAQEQGHT